jgi:hypothetical protein
VFALWFLGMGAAYMLAHALAWWFRARF